MNAFPCFAPSLEADGTLAGPWRRPVNLLRAQTYEAHASIHDDATAQRLGFRGGTIEGPTHFSQLTPLLLAAFGVMTFKTMLARVIAGQRVLDAALPSEAWRNGLRYLAFIALAAGAVVAIAVPVAAALALLGVMGVNLLPLFALAASMAVFAGAILLAFVGEAIALRGAGPWQAVKLSVRVVQRHTAPTAGLLLVLWVALVSLPPLLATIAFNALGVALAIAVYAFTATGLALARMLFVRDRLPAPAPRPDAA